MMEQGIKGINLEFEPDLMVLLPQTYRLLADANLTLHHGVSRVTLHGSRGLAGGWRPASDVDLSLIVDLPGDLSSAQREAMLKDVFDVTLQHWKSDAALDLAVIFETRGCGLACFERRTWDGRLCQKGGTDCFGFYKNMKGFTGLTDRPGAQVRLMYPCLKIWQRK